MNVEALADEATGEALIKPRLMRRKASEVTMLAPRWLWDGHIPENEITVLAGREGIGKSTCCYHWVAQITLGKMYGESYGRPRTVVIVATEDSIEHTIVPRLVAEGADLDLVEFIEGVVLLDEDGEPHESSLVLPRDNQQLHDTIAETDAALVLLDPLMSRMGVKDTHVDAEVRTALEPLAKIAHVTRASILGIIHVNKGSSGDILQSVMGSAAFTAVPRAVLYAMRDPEDENSRLVGIAKCNLGRDDLPAWRYNVDGESVGVDPTGRDIRTSKYVDLGRAVTSVRQASIAAIEASKKEKRKVSTAIGSCEAWLTEFLTASPHTDRTFIVKKATENDYSLSTLKAASRNIGVIKERSKTVPSFTMWSLPDDPLFAAMDD